MTDHPSEARLNDYVDGLLQPAERKELEGHLSRCGDCRREADQLGELLRSAEALGDVQPSRDLFPAIRAAATTATTSSPSPSSWARWGALAASLLILAGAFVVFTWLDDGEPESLAAIPADESLAELWAAEQDYVAASSRLMEALEQRRRELSPQTVSLIEEQVGIIDRAIADVRVAVERDKVGTNHAHLLTALYQKKIQLLWTASRLPS